LLTLAKAQAAVGQSQLAGKTAQSVLTALSGPVKSKIVADQISEARRLIEEQPLSADLTPIPATND